MLLEGINLPTVYSFRNTSRLSSKTEGIGIEIINTHTKFRICSRRIQTTYLQLIYIRQSSQTNKF